MELVPGRTLDQCIGTSRDGAPTLATAEAIAIARAIAEALEAAHDAGQNIKASCGPSTGSTRRDSRSAAG